MLVSIIVPVYNVEKYLKKCVDSLINQSYKDFEILLIDDGSTDSSRIICDEYANKYNFITSYHKKNSGLGLTRNYGMRYAKGKYITFVDSDDFVTPKMLENLVANIKKARADFVIGSFSRVDQNGKCFFKKHYKNEIFAGNQILDKLCPRVLGGLPNKNDDIKASVWNNLYNFEFIKENNLLFLSERKYVSEDIAWTIQCLKFANTVAVTSDSDYCYRVNNNSLSRKYNSQKFYLYNTFYKYILKEISNLGLDDDAIVRFQKQYLINLAASIFQEKNNNFKIAYSNIKKICNDKTVINVLSNYPVKKLKIKPRIFTILVKYKVTLVLSILIQLN